MRWVIKTCLLTLALACAVYVLWVYTHRFIFYRQTVLEVPIRFEEGFALNREFTVDISANYWVAVRYDEIFRSTVAAPVPHDEFTAESEIKAKDQLITKGGTANLPDWSGPWATNRDQVTRYLISFRAKPGENYWVSLRITSLLPGLVGTNPKALVEIQPEFTVFYELRKTLFIFAITGIAIIAFVICAYAAWRRRKSMHR